MITFALTGAIAFSSVLSAWGLIELKKKKDPLLPPVESKVAKFEKAKAAEEEKEELTDTEQADDENVVMVDKSPANSLNQSFLIVSNENQPEPVSEPSVDPKKSNTSNMKELINLLENELEKKKAEEQQIRRQQLTKLIEEEKRRRQQLEDLEKEKLEKKKQEEHFLKSLGRQIFALTIDHSLRSKETFTSEHPLTCQWNLSEIINEFESKRTSFNGRYHDCVPESVFEFLLYHPRFMINQEKYMIKLRYLTSYQGDAKVPGHFKCSTCSRYWKINSSKKDTPFKCKHCDIYIYPYKQEFEERELLNTV